MSRIMLLQPRYRTVLLLLGMLLTTLLVYWPALAGSFVYDDYVVIVDNPAVHVGALSSSEWAAAANAFPAAHQGRWLGMLSFAANHYIGGLDPWGYKLVNLLIHLFNGMLIWCVVDRLLQMRASMLGQSMVRTQRLAALALAALWLVLPINLTGAQYVVQRLESLSNTFVLLGLLVYLRLRVRDWQGERTGIRLPLAVLGFTAAGLLVKESAVLLPLYVACVEFVMPAMRRSDGSYSRTMLGVLGACLLLPLLLGLYWLSTWVGSEGSYARSYDSVERLLTQGRVMWHYIHWSLLPNLSDLTLYHDDIDISSGLLIPWTTLPALIGILALLACATLVRRRMPLFSLGIFWYFAGHALTATVIPLMLAFEHRNYFPSIGLLLAVVSLLSVETRWLRPRLQLLFLALAWAFYSGTTHLRALEWSHPLRLAASEAAKRPDSVDAQYNYIHLLLMAAGSDYESSYARLAAERIDTHRDMDGGGLMFDAAKMVLTARSGQPPDPTLWPRMRARMDGRAPRISDVSSLISIYKCIKDGACPPDYVQLRELMELTLAHPNVDVSLYSAHAELVYRHFGDVDAALASYARAVTKMPSNPAAYFNRAALLLQLGRLDEARADLRALERLDAFGSQARFIAPLRERLMPTGETISSPPR